MTANLADQDKDLVYVPTAQLALCVVYVRDLAASVGFYAQVLDLAVSVRTGAAAMLTTDHGCQIVLLERPIDVPQVPVTGIQYVVWTASGYQDLNNIELKLRCLDARVSRQIIDGVTYVEGRDPGGLPVIVTYPLPHGAPPAHIFNRIYGGVRSTGRSMTTPVLVSPSI